VRNSKTGGKHEESEIVEIAVPPILDEAVFKAVKAKLAANNPRVSPVRAVSGPILLTGLLTCAHCGGAMTQRTGTSSTGRVYSYYTCANRAQKGPTACKGNTIPMHYLDDLVLSALEEKVFAPEHIAELLSALIARRSERGVAVNGRLLSLQGEVQAAEDKLKRLYQAIEDGIAELDDILKERITALKAQRERAQAALERARQDDGMDIALKPEKIVAFTAMMRDILANRDNPTRKAYLRALLSAIEVDSGRIRIVGSRDVLYAAANGGGKPAEIVQFSGLKWRAISEQNSEHRLRRISRPKQRPGCATVLISIP
jgi:hypothetical protein